MKAMVLAAAGLLWLADAVAVESNKTFELNTMTENQMFSLDTTTGGTGTFYVETMADENGVRTISTVSEILPIAHFGSGSLTFTHENGIVQTVDFAEDGTTAWTPALSGRWTVRTTGATPGGMDTAVFVLTGGAAALSAFTMSDIELDASTGACTIRFVPTFADGAAQRGADWLTNSTASRLVKIRAATTLEALDTAAAAILDLDDLNATFDAETGVVTFDLSPETMRSVAPDAQSMFFKVEAR